MEQIKINTTGAGRGRCRARVVGGFAALALAGAGVLVTPRPAAAAPSAVCEHAETVGWVNDAGVNEITYICWDEWWPADLPDTPPGPVPDPNTTGGTGLDGGDLPFDVCPPYNSRGYRQALVNAEGTVAATTQALAAERSAWAASKASLANARIALADAQAREEAARAELDLLDQGLDPTGDGGRLHPSFVSKRSAVVTQALYNAKTDEIVQGNNVYFDEQEVLAHASEVEALELGLAEAQASLAFLQNCGG